MVDGEIPEKGLFPISVGERLRVAREAAKLDLNDVSTRTRIPLRHLTAIENSDYTALPSQTYALGFAKSYARAIGVDEIALGNDLRAELGRAHPDARDANVYEPADPSRVPPRLLAWTAALLALIIVVGYGVWRGGYFDSADVATPAPVIAQQETVAAAAPVAKPAATVGPGQVVLTATTAVWLRITDGAKTALFQKEMAAGETYQLPLTATDPKILTGRPDALKVTIDGREVAPLGGAKTTVRNLGISAAALNARVAVTPPPVAAGTTPVAAASPAVPQ
ncbi:helix-turn-helix domain-containing protein [Sphingomonas paeninsulae]|jgi:cytoskeleton protein RodZ|uniref:Helix-turn-helix domain-containing protein n=1 Tax=Sphingomonas paeninsulae TaxID=2319844 RepID=A0A494TBL5_SPHPE|nr:helix-turn-helix domain-containing protein [Sphingomonas paeninsulae]AYJ86520.1 helix-turn-helix domain-containing protein [Sphingomonas paeninsulae]